MAGRSIDLHTHSTASDGSDSPADLVRNAARVGLRALALTDHDTLSGLAEAEAEAAGLGVELVRGCEIAVRHDGDELHILGLFIPAHPSKTLEEALAGERGRRGRRNAAMLARLLELGLEITEEELNSAAGGEVVGRPHMASAMLARRYVGTRAEAFERYIGRDGSAFVPRGLLSPEEGIGLLRASGALTILAHPCLSPAMTPERLRACLAELTSYGLGAVEAYHSSHGNAAVRVCLECAKHFGLGVSGGSDYHGAAKVGLRLGRAGGGMNIPAWILDDLKELHHKTSRPPAP